MMSKKKKTLVERAYIVVVREYASWVVWEDWIILDQKLFKFFISGFPVWSSRVKQTSREGLNSAIFGRDYKNQKKKKKNS